MDLKPIIETLIFISEEPITVGTLMQILGDVSEEGVRNAIDQIRQKFDSPDSGLALVEVAGGWQFRTKPEYKDWIEKLNLPRPTRLSQAALETLAIIGYRQPIARSEIENIRGVDSDGVLKTLLERGLIRIIGRRDEPGRPLIYGTTPEFMKLFGLKHLSELPALKEYERLVESPPLTQSIETPIPLALDDIKPLTLDHSGEDEKLLDTLEESVDKIKSLEHSVLPKEKKQDNPA